MWTEQKPTRKLFRAAAAAYFTASCRLVATFVLFGDIYSTWAYTCVFFTLVRQYIQQTKLLLKKTWHPQDVPASPTNDKRTKNLRIKSCVCQNQTFKPLKFPPIGSNLNRKTKKNELSTTNLRWPPFLGWKCWPFSVRLLLLLRAAFACSL